MSWQHLFRGPPTLLVSLALTAVLGAAGCAGGEKPASVSGHVTYKGKPVTSGTVVLVTSDGKVSDPGAVQPDGSYKIAHSPTGTLKVAFDNPPPHASSGAKLPANDPENKANAEEAAHYVPTPPKYKDAQQSGLTVQIKRGQNSDCNIILQ
jgi:hypothetical protein